MPLPRGLDELLGQRIAALPSESQTVLFLAAAVPQPSVALLDEAHGGPRATCSSPPRTPASFG